MRTTAAKLISFFLSLLRVKTKPAMGRPKERKILRIVSVGGLTTYVVIAPHLDYLNLEDRLRQLEILKHSDSATILETGRTVSPINSNAVQKVSPPEQINHL